MKPLMGAGSKRKMLGESFYRSLHELRSPPGMKIQRTSLSLTLALSPRERDHAGAFSEEERRERSKE
jgi:hypothetical protein